MKKRLKEESDDDSFDDSLEDEEPQLKKDFDLEKESKKEIGEALIKIKENEKKFREEMQEECGTGFYFQVVFKNEKELQNFIKENNINLQFGDFVFYEDIKHIFK